MKRRFFETLTLLGSFGSICSFILSMYFIYYPQFIKIPVTEQTVTGDVIQTFQNVPLSTILFVASIIIGFFTLILILEKR